MRVLPATPRHGRRQHCAQMMDRPCGVKCPVLFGACRKMQSKSIRNQRAASGCSGHAALVSTKNLVTSHRELSHLKMLWPHVAHRHKSLHELSHLKNSFTACDAIPCQPSRCPPISGHAASYSAAACHSSPGIFQMLEAPAAPPPLLADLASPSLAVLRANEV